MSDSDRSWSDAALAKLANFIADPATYPSYGDMVEPLKSLKPGLKRNAIIGQVHRIQRNGGTLNTYLANKPELLKAVMAGIDKRSVNSPHRSFRKAATRKPNGWQRQSAEAAARAKKAKSGTGNGHANGHTNGTGAHKHESHPAEQGTAVTPYVNTEVGDDAGKFGKEHTDTMCDWPLGQHTEKDGTMHTVFCAHAKSPAAKALGRPYCDEHIVMSAPEGRRAAVRANIERLKAQKALPLPGAAQPEKLTVAS